MNILGIDFEDWYHPELIQKNLETNNRIPKVVDGIDNILDFLQKHEINATFFVVGELLEFKPEILDKILSSGNEIGFHTMHHDRLDSKSFIDKFDQELKEFSKLTNDKSKGFRAPTFSLNQQSSTAVDILIKNNYLYDSSIMPAKTSMYGNPNAEKKPYKISSKNLFQNDPSSSLYEFPLLVTKFLGKTIPAAGGFYLRTLPLKIIKNAIHQYEEQSIPACFYIHSWELTPEYMPDVPMPKKDHFITYHNLNKAKSRLGEILETFQFTSFENFIKLS